MSEVVAGMAQKARERRVFLFEQIIIFSEMLERKKGDFSNASYIYKNSLKVSVNRHRWNFINLCLLRNLQKEDSWNNCTVRNRSTEHSLFILCQSSV